MGVPVALVVWQLGKHGLSLCQPACLTALGHGAEHVHSVRHGRAELNVHGRFLLQTSLLRVLPPANGRSEKGAARGKGVSLGRSSHLES